LPFPLSDSLYGLTPDAGEDFGLHLGSLAPRGERGALIVSLDALLRMSSNPFFPYLAERIDERLPAKSVDAAPPAGGEAVVTRAQTSEPQRTRQRDRKSKKPVDNASPGGAR
jgi:hypothetical protein